MAMRMTVPYITYATFSKEQTGDIIMFSQFEEGNLLSKSHNGTESGDKSDEYSTLPPLTSEAKMDKMSQGNEYDAEPMYTDMLEYIRNGSQSRPCINRREACYKIRDCIKKRRAEWKGSLLSMQKMGKVSHKVFKADVNELSESLPVMGESRS